MLRRFLIITGLVAMFVPLGMGCSTREPVIWGWPHNKRRIMKVMDDFHKMHTSFDRIIFDMEEYPIEPDYF